MNKKLHLDFSKVSKEVTKELIESMQKYSSDKIMVLNRPKLMIVGHGRHGKDTVCEMLQARGFRFQSSSWHCAKIVFEKLKELYDYSNVKECFEDRHNHRSEWFDIITSHNSPDKAKIAKEIYAEHDIYAGMRNITEFNECRRQGVFDLAIWVDASKRLPPEDISSMQITPLDCDLIIDNNGDLQQLSTKVSMVEKLIT